MSLRDLQIARERNQTVRGVERYMRQREIDQAAGREYDSTVGQRFVDRMMDALIPAIEKEQNEVTTDKLVPAALTGRRLSGYEMALISLPAYQVAYITLRTVLNAVKDERTRQTLGQQVGKMLDLQSKLNQLEENERARAKSGEGVGYNRLTYLKKEVKRINPRSVRKWLRRLDDITVVEWDRDTRIKVGVRCVEIAVEVLPEAFYERSVMEDGKTRLTIEVTEEATTRLLEEHDEMALSLPWYTPMIAPPKDWVPGQSGGWWHHEADIVKKNRYGSSGKASVECYRAVNRVQASAYRVNRQVVTVARMAIEQKLEDLLPVRLSQVVPEQVPADEWEAMTDSQRAKVKRERREIHDLNFKLESKRQLMRRQLAVAEECADDGAIWFPHQFDFRGRIYPMPQDLHPQSDDFARGMLEFAKGYRLGTNGLYWLMFQAANAYGLDKESREDQVQWAYDHLEDIFQTAVDPLGDGYEFFAKAKEKWQFLAAAFDIDAAMCLEDPTHHVSHLIVSVDGSCNGLQHLSAMGRDNVGAHSVNLTADPERQDIYGIVADKVSEQVIWDYEADRKDDDPRRRGALAWVGKVTRDTVKRGVMTLPYGVTPVGMRDQLINDDQLVGVEGDLHENATYMRDCMMVAMEDTIEKAVGIMAWMQDNASILAKNNHPVVWTAPSGFEVTMSYNKMQPRRMTILGSSRVSVFDPVPGQLRTEKQALAVAPNIVHSFDAAHLVMSVNAAPEHLSFSAVHDSLGCHAAHMPEFLDCIREQFVRIYVDDWFARLQGDFETSRNGQDYPLHQPPAIGDFDVSEVLRSDWFFA